MKEAESYSGVPYVFGGTTPSGFDCSGYVRYVFAKSGITLPRSADEQYTVGKTISKHNLQPGDLVFSKLMNKAYPILVFMLVKVNSSVLRLVVV